MREQSCNIELSHVRILYKTTNNAAKSFYACYKQKSSFQHPYMMCLSFALTNDRLSAAWLTRFKSSAELCPVCVSQHNKFPSSDWFRHFHLTHSYLNYHNYFNILKSVFLIHRLTNSAFVSYWFVSVIVWFALIYSSTQYTAANLLQQHVDVHHWNSKYLNNNNQTFLQLIN